MHPARARPRLDVVDEALTEPLPRALRMNRHLVHVGIVVDNFDEDAADRAVVAAYRDPRSACLGDGDEVGLGGGSLSETASMPIARNAAPAARMRSITDPISAARAEGMITSCATKNCLRLRSREQARSMIVCAAPGDWPVWSLLAERVFRRGFSAQSAAGRRPPQPAGRLRAGAEGADELAGAQPILLSEPVPVRRRPTGSRTLVSGPCCCRCCCRTLRLE